MGLDTVEFVIETEGVFLIDISDDEASKTETVENYCKLVRKKCVLKHGFNAPSYSSIYQDIVEILSAEFLVDRDQIHPNSKFVKDLGLD